MNFCKIFLFFFSAVLASCADGSFKPTVTGAAFDLLVVGSESTWKGQAGEDIFNSFGSAMPCLPQDEANFNVIFLQEKLFDHVVKPARNIIIYNVDPKMYTKGSIHFQNDVWAKPQAVAVINAPSDSVLSRTVLGNRVRLLRFFTNAEEKRAVNYFSSYQNLSYSQMVQKRFGVDILVPADMNRVKEGKDFLWMSNTSLDVTKSIAVFSSPYGSQSDFSPAHLLSVQDSFTKANIPGPAEGSYMCVQSKADTVTEVLQVPNADYCVEVRGLWHCNGDIMGGPYVNRTYLSADHKSLVSCLVFLYSPGHNKRNALRMLEACAGSIKTRPDSIASSN